MNTIFRTLVSLLVCWSFAAPAGAQRLERCYESVLLLGDSNVYGALGHSLQHDFQTNGSLVFREGKPGSGLARPDFHDWPSEARFLVEIIDPDIVVLMLGGNDIQRMRDTKGRFGEGIPWEDEDRWIQEYRARMAALLVGIKAVDPASIKKDRRLVILSPTNRRPAMNRERVQRIVELQRKELSTRQDVHWVDAFALTTTETGRYLDKGYRKDGTVIPFRKSDGIHLTRAGADDLAVRIRNILFRGCPNSTTAGR
jgi:hypothetical protein